MKAVFNRIVLMLLPALPLLGQVSVSLTVDPTHVPPGVPASFHLAIRNDGDAAISLPSKLLLRVVPSTGNPFFAEWGAGQEHRFSNAVLPPHAPTAIPAHSQREVTFTAYALDRAPGWFYDPRLNRPGTYRLQLAFLDTLNETLVGQTAALTAEQGMPVRFSSAEAVLNVDAPKDGDLVLWNRLLAMAKRHGYDYWSPLFWGDLGWNDFVGEAIEKYPSSPYAAMTIRDYASRSGSDRLTPEERIANAQRVLKAQPSTSVREDAELFIAEMEVVAAQRAASLPKHDMVRAISLYDRARSDFDALERTARDPEIRTRSREQRERLPTANDLREMAESRSN